MLHKEINNQRDGAKWLILAVAALAAGGVYSILLVLLRTPKLQEMIPWRDFFHTALIVHVDLTVLVWFLAIACLLATLFTTQRSDMLSKAGFWCFAGGTALMAICPFLAEQNPLINNYIPVLKQVPFFLSLSLIATGVILTLLWRLQDNAKPSISNPLSVVMFGVYGGCLVATVSMISFVVSYLQVEPKPDDLVHYYELVFWGGGHLLQFTHTQMMLVAWILLFTAAFPESSLNWKLILAAFAINTMAAIPMPLSYLLYNAESIEHYTIFTEHMKMFGGLSAALLIAYFFYCIFKQKLLVKLIQSGFRITPPLAYLDSSILMFIAGGVIGYMISGYNVTIPAHYHGSIVGVSLAFMGIVAVMLPSLGYSAPTGKAWIIQPYLYAVGQLMHIIGLAWSGGYGALRKNPEIIADPNIKVAMGLMGAGGLIAIIAGLMFVVMVYMAVKKGTNP